MKNLKQLRQQRADLKAQGNALLKAAEDENRDLTAEEDAQFEDIKGQIEAVDAEIEQAERWQERRRAMQPDADAPRAQGVEVNDPHRVRVGEDRAQLDPTGGWTSLAEFASAVRDANPRNPGHHVDQRLLAQPTSPHLEQGSEEGYMVPTEYRNTIFEIMFEDGSLLNRFNFEPTSRSSVMKLRDQTTPWGGSGVTAYWTSENSQLTESKLKTEENLVKLHKLHAFVTASDELLSDAPMLQSRLSRKSGEAIRWKMVDAIVNGDGVGKPLGWMNSGALVSAAELSPGGSPQADDSIIADNVVDMFSRLLPSSVRRAFWLVNPDALPQLLTMTLGDNSVYVLPNEGFRSAPGGFLLGRPVVFHEVAQTVGDKGDIQLIDPAGYFAIRKAGANMGMKFATSIHLFFDYDVQAFRWTVRIGGEPYLDEAITPPNSTVTKSHFVALDARDGS